MCSSSVENFIEITRGKSVSPPLSVPVGQQILLNFTVFDMENHTNCNFDYLEIR